MTTINSAQPQQLNEIYSHFRARTDVFPHIRRDSLARRIEHGECIYTEGVIITYQQYRKRVRLGTAVIPKGAFMLHQILNSSPGNGWGHKIFNAFCEVIVAPSSSQLFLTVRTANSTARSFYDRLGMHQIGTIEWSLQGRPLDGVILYKEIGPDSRATP